MKIDFLIVGHGLAGASLAYLLVKQGARVVVLDTPDANYSSRVAAGLYNPVTGRQMTKTWLADELFPYLEEFYRAAEQDFVASFLHHQAIYRPFFSIEEQNEWTAKEGDARFASVIERVSSTSIGNKEINDPYGGLWLKGGGYMDVPAFLEASLRFLGAAYRKEYFDEAQLELSHEGIRYQNIHARKVVYCNGLAAQDSLFWKELPFHPLKGEILDLTLTDEAEWGKFILNRGVFIFNNADGQIRCGSTYNWQQVNLEPTSEGKTEILDKLGNIYKGQVELRQHRVGIRPSTRDRRPLIGIHPQYEQVAIFNGLGTKGVSLAPYFAVQMKELLISGKSVDPRVDIARYLC